MENKITKNKEKTLDEKLSELLKEEIKYMKNNKNNKNNNYHKKKCKEKLEEEICKCTTYNWPCLNCSKKADEFGYSYEDWYGYPESEENEF